VPEIQQRGIETLQVHLPGLEQDLEGAQSLEEKELLHLPLDENREQVITKII